ncbi:hypothetical protein GCM10022393_09400 [Aquimarina addita]|uniref:Zinc ribbon domain-containing protein n=1 Tax=Aquimarina addita TaxID=870485 RepID=A0ABP7XCG2_9FLAO
MEEITIQSALCSQCNFGITLETKFCTHCGFPEHGDEKEQAVFHANKVMKKSKIKDDAKKINSARKTLYWMAGIFFVFGLFYYFTLQDISVLLVNVVLAVIYLVLAYWSQKKPFAALLSALLLYLTVVAMNAIAEPVSLFQGIIFKILIISFLIKGINSASQTAKK